MMIVYYLRSPWLEVGDSLCICYAAEHVCWLFASWDESCILVILEGKERSVNSGSKRPLSLSGDEGNEK